MIFNSNRLGSKVMVLIAYSKTITPWVLDQKDKLAYKIGVWEL